ncbi:unnamed protein product [Kluyveromyces dobzhanskii CBS 2104]|uniref:WGS project CCBQ000000000 data, contig 00102 n=1 Tax=Kluyveromyces dobzhanskii CBS 2104 TaxID=1427455 RepID=A0A0A8L6B5_9SACH|nr:unnamed protein product [Kluyveromyces dobzhanskii CBS 2104]
MSKKLTDVLAKKLDFVNDTPIDTFFQRLDDFFKPINEDDNYTNIYEVLHLTNSKLVEILGEHLKHLIQLVAAKQNENGDIIPVSLHDMKHFDMLINLLVIHGINANLPIDIGIPLEQRRLDGFREESKLFTVPQGQPANIETLACALSAFELVFFDTPETNYVRRILLKGGPGYADTLIGYIASMYTTNDRIFEEKLRKLENVKDTYSLFEIYSLLLTCMRNDKSKEWPLKRLSLLLVERDDGLISLIDFVVGVREDAEVEISKFERVNQIVTSKPKSLSSVVYFEKLFVQIYEGLTHIDKPVLISCLNGLVTAFYLKNKRIVRDFLFAKIYRVLYNPELTDISAKELNDMNNVLVSLGRSLYVEVLNDMIMGYDNGQSFYLNLWIYSMFLKKNQKLTPNGGKDHYYNITLGLIKTYLAITDGYEHIHVILLNMVNYNHDKWEYKIDFESQLAYIVLKTPNIAEDLGIGKLSVEEKSTKRFQSLFMEIDPAVELFIELLAKIDDQQVNKSIFSAVINNWLMQVPRKNSLNPINDEEDESFSDNLQSMIFLKVLEKMNEVFKSNMLTEPADLLIIILQILDFAGNINGIAAEADSDDEDEDEDDDNETAGNIIINDNTLQVAIKLLTSVLSTFHTTCSAKERNLLTTIRKKIEIFISRADCREVYDLVTNVLALPVTEGKIDGSDEQDRTLLKKALANVNDPLVPIRAHGLLQLRQLIEKNSSLIDTKRVFAIHMTQLHDQDAFIYLNVIRGLGVLLQIVPEETLELLLKFYSAVKSKNSVDDILKVGEVLINYVLVQDKAFVGTSTARLVEVCLENIRMKDQVDNRIRMSSMSILGQCLQSNARGVQSNIADILDCAFGILTFEAGEDIDDSDIKKHSAIMRRGAIYLIYDLMSNSGLDLFPDNFPPTKIKNTLEYVATEDTDYLVCEQAKSVLDQLDIHLHNNAIDAVQKLSNEPASF